ncbi:Alpha/beta hydrolase domain-containing protein 17B [Blomia tropicalis]|nr:Alpha/beta hydrolase domain-containing protein 17B [Blomia tropicalis]
MSSILRDVFSSFVSHFFQHSPPKTYEFHCDEVASRFEMRMKRSNHNSICNNHPERFEPLFIKSKSGNNIACLMIRPPIEQPRYTILFNHGSTVDLGNLCNFLHTLGTRLQCNIFVYDYSGFGQSKGTPTEKAVYADADAAMDCLMNRFNISQEKIILYGQSMGTAPALMLAGKYVNVRGIILHSPFLSFAKVFMGKFHRRTKLRFYDFYRNVEMIGNITSTMPILIMHGTKDRIVPIEHAKQLHLKAGNSIRPLWVEGGGHDDLYTFDVYTKRLKRFVEEEL